MWAVKQTPTVYSRGTGNRAKERVANIFQTRIINKVDDSSRDIEKTLVKKYDTAG